MADTGNSFWSDLKDNLTEFSDFQVPMDLLPALISPFEKQLRVAVNGVEYTYDDGSDPTLTTAMWTYAVPAAPTSGLVVSGVRLTFEAINVALAAQFSEINLRDGDGVWFTDLASVTRSGTFISGGSNDENAFDLDAETHATGPTGSAVLKFDFDSPRSVSAVGWAPKDGGITDNAVEDMTVEVNLGTVLSPNWVEAAEVLDLVQGDYPTTPANPWSEQQFDNVLVLDDTLDDSIASGPTITITPALADGEDRLTMWRETRQDRPHNPPASGGRASSEHLHWFFMQRLFIMQDLAEYQELGGFLDYVPYTGETFDLTVGSQVHEHLNHSTTDTFSFSDIELLEGVPGNTNFANQIIIEQGNKTDGTSTFWDLQAVTSEYTVDSSAKTVTRVAGNTTLDVRIRRQTKIDGLWFDLRGGPPPWNSLAMVTIMRQLRFLVEESPYVPVFLQGSLLDNTIFPREWNWLIYTGTDLFYIFGGPFWTGDGEITVWDNDLQLTDPTNYTTEYPKINFVGPITEPHIGSTGNYWKEGGAPLPGDGTDAPAGQTDPPEDGSPIDGDDPLFNAVPSLSISISFVASTTVDTGPIEGFPSGIDISMGNASAFENNMYLKIDLTVAAAFTGESTVNKRIVAYCNTVCPTGSGSTGLRAAAEAVDANGDGTFEGTTEGSAALGCLDASAIPTNLTGLWANWISHRGAYSDRELVTAPERAARQIFDAGGSLILDHLTDSPVIQGMDALVNENIAGGSNGTTDPSDINNILGP